MPRQHLTIHPSPHPPPGTLRGPTCLPRNPLLACEGYDTDFATTEKTKVVHSPPLISWPRSMYKAPFEHTHPSSILQDCPPRGSTFLRHVFL